MESDIVSKNINRFVKRSVISNVKISFEKKEYIITSDVMKIILSFLLIDLKEWKNNYKSLILVSKTFYQTTMHVTSFRFVNELNFLDHNKLIDKIISFTYYTKMLIVLKKKEWHSLTMDSLFLWATSRGLYKIVKLLLKDNKLNFYDNWKYSILNPSENGHIKTVELLLKDKRIDPSVCKNYSIRWASKKGHLKIIELLLKDDRINPSDYDNQAINWASEHDRVEIAKLLLTDQRVKEYAIKALVKLWKDGSKE